MKADSKGVYFAMRVPAKPVVKTASLEVTSMGLPVLEAARKARGAPSDATWVYYKDSKQVMFTWKEE